MSGGDDGPDLAGVTMTARSPVPTMASTAVVSGQVRRGMPRSRMPGCAIRQSSMATTSCERCFRRPAAPSSRTANWTRVRQPSPCWPPVSSPGIGSTVTSRSMPAIRRSCCPITAAFSARCAERLACCQSQPPQPPGCAYGQGAATRSGDGSRISTASARANRDVTSVTRATTRSPGSACLTNSTGSPGGLATHQPPCATSSVVTSTASPTSKTTAPTSLFWGRILPREGIPLARCPKRALPAL